MSRNTQTFATPRALEVMDSIIDFMTEHRRATAGELATFIGMSQIQSAAYLKQMEKLGRIHCIERPKHFQGGRTPTIWGPGGGPDAADAPRSNGFVRQVVVRGNWTPNHQRMAMDCLLFGVPAAMQGAAA